MSHIKTNYNSDSPRDVSDFLMAISELWQSKIDGPSRANRAIEEMAKQGSKGRQLLFNCHLVVSRQIPLVKERDLLPMFQSLQQIFGVFARGGSKF